MPSVDLYRKNCWSPLIYIVFFTITYSLRIRDLRVPMTHEFEMKHKQIILFSLDVPILRGPMRK